MRIYESRKNSIPININFFCSWVFREQFKSGQAQEAAGDFAGAWDSFTHAEATVADDGVFAKLLGGLSAEQEEVRRRREATSIPMIVRPTDQQVRRNNSLAPSRSRCT